MMTKGTKEAGIRVGRVFAIGLLALATCGTAGAAQATGEPDYTAWAATASTNCWLNGRTGEGNHLRVRADQVLTVKVSPVIQRDARDAKRSFVVVAGAPRMDLFLSPQLDTPEQAAVFADHLTANLQSCLLAGHPLGGAEQRAVQADAPASPR